MDSSLFDLVMPSEPCAQHLCSLSDFDVAELRDSLWRMAPPFYRPFPSTGPLVGLLSVVPSV